VLKEKYVVEQHFDVVVEDNINNKINPMEVDK
jgi:hypothetical protein